MAEQQVSGFGYVAAFLDAYPEIKAIVEAAGQPGAEWSQARFETAIRGTEWYRSRSEAQRQWDVEEKQDPTQAAKTKADAENKIRNMAGQLGITLDDQAVTDLSNAVYRNGADDAAIRLAMSRYMPAGETEPNATPSVEDVRQLAWEYGVPVGNAKLNQWAQDIVAGRQTIDGLKGFFSTAAASLYPEFQQQLQAGMSTRDMLEPYMQLASKTLEIDPTQMTLTDPKWVPTASTPEGTKVLTLQEWQKKLRSDPNYGFRYTAGARDEAFAMTSRLGRLFGSY